MVTWEGDADNDAFGTNELGKKADYDTSSGNSFWVRQYLEWCESAGDDWPQGRRHSNLVIEPCVHAVTIAPVHTA